MGVKKRKLGTEIISKDQSWEELFAKIEKKMKPGMHYHIETIEKTPGYTKVVVYEVNKEYLRAHMPHSIAQTIK